MIGIGLGLGLFKGGSFDADYQAVLNYATIQGYTLPSPAQQVKQNTLLVSLKSAGIWNKLDTFCVFANDGGSNFGLIDWKRLSLYTAVNSPAFSVNNGFTGNGTSSYIDTNFNPATSGINYTLNNASRFLWVKVIPPNFKHYDGNSATQDNCLEPNNGGRQRINQSNIPNSTNVGFSVIGLIAINRITDIESVSFNNTTQKSLTSTSTSIANLNQWVGRSSNIYSPQQTSIYGMGASLVSENTALRNALNNYLTSL